MKTFTSILFVLSLSFSAFAGARCERLESYDMTNLRASFEQDLLTHVWRTSVLGDVSNLYFQDDGIVLVVSTGSEAVDSYLWSVTDDKGQNVLAFYSPAGNKEFSIAPTCNGISAAAHGKSTPLAISTDEMLSIKQLDFLRLQLAGTWYAETSRSRGVNSVPFSIALNQDGTFTMTNGPDTYHARQEGIWQLSQDGQFLILHTPQYIGDEKKYVAESIRLRSVDFEDMVIDAEILPRELKQYSGKQLIYLTKARA